MTAISMPRTLVSPVRRRMPLLMALTALLGWTGVLSGCATVRPDPDRITWQPLAPQVWWLPGAVATSNAENLGNISNHVFVQDSDGGTQRGWLIGSGASPAWGGRLRASLQAQLGAQVTDIIAPRAHPETVLGAAAFPETRHWALPEVTAAMTARCPICLDNLLHQTADVSLSPATVRLPDHAIVAGAGELLAPRLARLGPLDIWAVQRAASDWTTLIHHRDSGYWFSPGLVWGSDALPELREANTLMLIDTLGWLQGQLNAQSRIVPEQGAPGDVGLVTLNRGYWQALLAECEAAQARGDGELDFIGISASPAAQKFAASALNVNRESLNRQRIWREVEER